MLFRSILLTLKHAWLSLSIKVHHDERSAWENYTNHHPDGGWYEHSRLYQKHVGLDDLDNRPQVKTDDPELNLNTGVANYIYDFQRETTGKGVISPEAGK